MSYDLYKEIILDYYRNPRNKGKIENPQIYARDSNPLCGDVIEMYGVVKDGVIEELKFSGEGCAISQAAASMLTEMVIGKNLEEVRKIGKVEILETLGTPELGPARIKCALLGLKVFKIGLYTHLGDTIDSRKEGLE